MKYLYIYLILTFSYSCAQKNDVKDKKIQIDYAVKELYKKNREVKQIIDALDLAYNTTDIKRFKKFWFEDDFLKLKEPYKDLYFSFNNSYATFVPTIVSVYNNESFTSNSYVVKIAIMGNPEGFNSLFKIYDLGVVFVNDKPKFKNLFLENLKEYKSERIENIEYFYKEKNNVLNKTEVNEQLEFDDLISNFLNKKEINYTFIVCSSFKEVLKLQPFDFVDNMYLNNSTGGMALGRESIVISGNNSFIYPHEVVHLYMAKYYPNRHNLLDEGMATYLGGSLGNTYKELLPLLKAETKNTNLYDSAFNESLHGQFLKNGTPIFYVIGALICDLAYKRKGLDGLELLISEGYKNKELVIENIEEIFEIDRADFDTFIKNELENYNFEKY